MKGKSRMIDATLEKENQTDMFDYCRIDTKYPSVLKKEYRNPEEGKRLRDQGINRAVNHVERITADWKKKALQIVKDYPRTEFKTEDVRGFAYRIGLPEPLSERAWGAIINKAKKLGIIEFVRFEAVNNPKAHRTPASVWKKV